MVTGILSLSSFMLWNEEPIKGVHYTFFWRPSGFLPDSSDPDDKKETRS